MAFGRSRKRVTAVSTYAFLLGAISVIWAPSSMAQTGCGTLQSGHCYAVDEMGSLANATPIYMTSIGVDLEVDCLTVGNQNSQFADWEMWMATNVHKAGDDSTYLEAGYNAGTINDIGGTNYTGFQWFWADTRTGYGQDTHFISWATAGQYKNVTFASQGSGNWNVVLAGRVVGYSKGVGDYAGGANIGAEMAVDTRGQTWAHAQHWQYTNGGTWHPVNPGVGITAGNPPGFSTGTAYNPTAFTVHTPAHPCGTTPLGVAGNVRAQTLAAPQSMATVTKAAKSLAAASGDAAPTAVSTVKTTRGAANQLDGESVGSTELARTVYMVEEFGHFTATGSVPRGYKRFTGNVLHFVIDAQTGQVLDEGVFKRSAAAGMAKLGKVARVTIG